MVLLVSPLKDFQQKWPRIIKYKENFKIVLIYVTIVIFYVTIIVFYVTVVVFISPELQTLHSSHKILKSSLKMFWKISLATTLQHNIYKSLLLAK